VNRFLTAHQHN